MSENIPTHKPPSELAEIARDLFRFSQWALSPLRPSFTRSANSELKKNQTYYVENTKKLLAAEYKTYGELDFEPDTARLVGKTTDGFPLLELKSEDGKQKVLMQTDWRGKKLSPIDLGLDTRRNEAFKAGQYFVVSDSGLFANNVAQIIDNQRNKELQLARTSADFEEQSGHQISISNKDKLILETTDVNGNMVFRFVQETAALGDIEILVKASKKQTPEGLGLKLATEDLVFTQAMARAAAGMLHRRY